MHGIGERIRELRKSKEVTQKEFSSMLGVTGSYVSAIEKGKKVPSRMFVILVSEKFCIDIEWLLTGKGDASAKISMGGGRMKTKNLMEWETEKKSISEILKEVGEDICDNYCKFRNTGDEEYLCDMIREGRGCPLDRLN